MSLNSERASLSKIFIYRKETDRPFSCVVGTIPFVYLPIRRKKKEEKEEKEEIEESRKREERGDVEYERGRLVDLRSFYKHNYRPIKSTGCDPTEL